MKAVKRRVAARAVKNPARSAAVADQPREADGRFASRGFASAEVRRRKRKLHDGTMADPGPEKRWKASERLAAVYARKPVHRAAPLVDPRTGETYRVDVRKNAYHLGYREERKYRVAVHGSKTGDNDSEPVDGLEKAIRRAEALRKQLIRDGLKPAGPRRRILNTLKARRS